ncbi:hypothetical protein [uncultured Corynebacterium sp.]|uniref:hypothetical protein n=1 Tax=uncultured Corynebacterium sp. TaxID=159447 RepID=UPI0028060104|nr:hypothetical protein [uncultured Corynebacterium sp.]
MTTSHPVAELTFGTPDALKNLGVLAHKAYALDENTLLRIRARKTTTAAGISSSSEPTAAPAMSQVWVKTPIGPLAMRTIALHALPDDIIVTAAEIKDIAVRAFAQAKSSDDAEDKEASLTALPYRVHAQSASSWPGFLPVPEGWQVVDYVPATAFRTLEKQGRAVAVESSGPMGMPPSLLDQKVLTVSGDTSDAATGTATASGEATVDSGEGQSQETSKSVVDVTMRDVFALCAMGFIPEQPDEKEPVRVSTKGRWHRLDGRFGSIFTLESFGVLPLLN